MIKTVDAKKRERQKNLTGLALMLLVVILVVIAAVGLTQQVPQPIK